MKLKHVLLFQLPPQIHFRNGIFFLLLLYILSWFALTSQPTPTLFCCFLFTYKKHTKELIVQLTLASVYAYNFNDIWLFSYAKSLLNPLQEVKQKLSLHFLLSLFLSEDCHSKGIKAKTRLIDRSSSVYIYDNFQ